MSNLFPTPAPAQQAPISNAQHASHAPPGASFVSPSLPSLFSPREAALPPPRYAGNDNSFPIGMLDADVVGHNF
jgi:hypothetical protein